MTKGLFTIAMAAIMLTACGGKQSTTTPELQTADSVHADTLADKQQATYLTAIDSYLVSEIGRAYLQGTYCIPFHNIVEVDESNADDILVWGDFWVFQYNVSGDTLKTVSGGSHPGLMHVRQTESNFEVTGFDGVEDGASYLPTAKVIFGELFDDFQAVASDDKKREELRTITIADYVRKHSLPVTMYQDYGWPAVKLPLEQD